MAIPSQVDEAAELAEKLHHRMFGSEEDTSEEESSGTEDNEQEEENEEQELEDNEDDTPHDDDLEELRKFKARYLSLKGKYDAEVPRLHQDLRELKTSVFEKLTSLADNQPAPKEEPKGGDIFSRLKEEYGDDFIDSVRSIAEQIAEEKIKATINPVQEKVLSVEDTQLKIAQNDFKAYLDSKVEGDWRNLWEGKDTKFLEFLQQPDPSGLYTYADLIQLYNDNWEADKLATVFNKYLETKKPNKQAVEPPKPNPTRDAMVAPSRTTTHTTPDTSDKIIWTKDSISEFQKLDRQGKFTPEESKAKWDDLLAAPSEGRIR